MADIHTVGAIEEKKAVKTVLGEGVAESILGGATIVLVLLGLSGVMPLTLLSIAVIAMGAGFLLEGAAISMRFSKLLSESAATRERTAEGQLGVGLSAEFVGGIAGVILGILALIGISPLVLASTAVIVFGSILMLSSGFKVRFNALEFETIDRTTRFKKIAQEAMIATAGVEFILGLSVAILGILAVTGVYSLTLGLVGLLIIGITGFITGTALSARMLTLSRKTE